jgi:hypothetical protein
MQEVITLSDDWLLEKVVPNIHRHYRNDSRLCKVLAHALLFAAIDGASGEMIPPEICNRITQAYLVRYPDTQQPIERVLLVVYRVEDTLCIDERAVRAANTAAT